MTIYETPTDHKPAIPVWFTIAAWSVPALMLGDLTGQDIGWYAALPAFAMLIASFVDSRLRPLRWWTAAMTGLLAIPFFVDYESGFGILQDMHPINLATFGLASVVLLYKIMRKH